MADNPQKIPSYPAIVLIITIPVKSHIAKRANNITSDPNTTCRALLILSVQININNVNNPRIAKKNPIESSLAAVIPVLIFGKIRVVTNQIQKNQYAVNAVAPNVLFFFRSWTPAITCIIPHTKIHMAIIIAFNSKNPAL